MRTAIYMGFIAVADAINKEWSSGEHTGIYAIVLVAVIVMDLIDFVRGRNER